MTYYLRSPEMWHTSGDEHRSRRSQLPVDTSSTTYLHRDAGYAPLIQDRVTHNTFITHGHHRHVNLLVLVLIQTKYQCIFVLLGFRSQLVVMWFSTACFQ